MYNIFQIDTETHKKELKDIKKSYKESFPSEERVPCFLIKHGIKQFITEKKPEKKTYFKF